MKSFFLLKQRLSPWQVWIGILVFFVLSGLIAGVFVLWKGLSITNLSDFVPWGLWITIDLSSIALSAGAFSLCAVVYLLGLKRFEPVARTATFIGLIGYTMALLALLLDIGRPDRFWHALVYWNHHSLLWEVTMCVCLYLVVLILETMPLFSRLEWVQNRWPRLAQKMATVHHYAPYLAVAGLCLSMLHQSSLGAVYGVLKARPVWYRPGISVLFIISAVAGGMALTALASMISARLTSRARVNDSLVEQVSAIVGWILVAYLYFRFWDALALGYTYQPGRSEGLRILTNGALSFNFWVGEIFLGALIPIFLLLNRRTRSMPLFRMIALALVVGGVVAYRWDTNMSGLLVVLYSLPGEPVIGYANYFPSFVEFVSAAGIVAYGVLAFSLGVRYLRVVEHPVDESEVIYQTLPEPAAAD